MSTNNIEIDEFIDKVVIDLKTKNLDMLEKIKTESSQNKNNYNLGVKILRETYHIIMPDPKFRYYLNFHKHNSYNKEFFISLTREEKEDLYGFFIFQIHAFHNLEERFSCDVNCGYEKITDIFKKIGKRATN